MFYPPAEACKTLDQQAFSPPPPLKIPQHFEWRIAGSLLVLDKEEARWGNTQALFYMLK